jgi:hypothetical protein
MPYSAAVVKRPSRFEVTKVISRVKYLIANTLNPQYLSQCEASQRKETEMTEGTPMTPEEIRRLNRDLMEKMLDKAESDEQWKQRLLDDPEAAMLEAGFPEAERLQEMQASTQSVQDEEVRGQQINCVHAGFTGLPGPNFVSKWC